MEQMLKKLVLAQSHPPISVEKNSPNPIPKFSIGEEGSRIGRGTIVDGIAGHGVTNQRAAGQGAIGHGIVGGGAADQGVVDLGHGTTGLENETADQGDWGGVRVGQMGWGGGMDYESWGGVVEPNGVGGGSHRGEIGVWGCRGSNGQATWVAVV